MWHARCKGPRIPSRTPDANLDCSFVKTALVYVVGGSFLSVPPFMTLQVGTVSVILVKATKVLHWRGKGMKCQFHATLGFTTLVTFHSVAASFVADGGDIYRLVKTDP